MYVWSPQLEDKKTFTLLWSLLLFGIGYYEWVKVIQLYPSLCPILCYIGFCFSYWYVGVLERSSVEYNFPLPIHLGGSDGKASVCNVGDPGSSPGLGRSPGEGNCNPLQYYCLEIPMDRGSWQATVHEVARVGHNLATKPPPPIWS